LKDVASVLGRKGRDHGWTIGCVDRSPEVRQWSVGLAHPAILRDGPVS
jgi:hypothetical protein